MLPEPRYIVFYNGKEDEPDEQELRLSDAFKKKASASENTAALECVAVMFAGQSEKKRVNKRKQEKIRDIEFWFSVNMFAKTSI